MRGGCTVDCTDSHIDLVFVLDSSGSIRDQNDDGQPDNYDLMLQFMANIVDDLDIGPEATQVGLVRFSDIGELMFPLGRYSTKQALREQILATSYIGSNTNTSGGLYVMYSEAFTEANGDRPGIPNVGVVITDGFSTTDNQSTVPNAVRARQMGIELFAVGITNNINLQELRLISSEPQLENVNYFVSDDFATLDEQVRPALIDQTCTTDGSQYHAFLISALLLLTHLHV